LIMAIRLSLFIRLSKIDIHLPKMR
jgi:hypothetical protein